MRQSQLRATIDDPTRLSALYETEMLGAIAEPAFDGLTRLAARLLHSPVVIVSLVDSTRDFILSGYGLPEPLRESREIVGTPTFCQYSVAAGKPYSVDDARTDPEFAHFPAVLDMGVVACLNAPLITTAGHAIGNLCVIDFESRSWTDDDREIISTLASTAIHDIELRVRTRESERSRGEVKLVLERIPEALFVLDRGWHFTFINQKAELLLGVDAKSLVGREVWDSLPALTSLVGDELLRAVSGTGGFGFEMFIEPYQRWFDIQLDPSDSGLSVYMRDTTERHVVEEQMRQSAKMDAVGQLASGIAHDFNNLLTVITTCGEMLISELSPGDASFADAQEIASAAKRAAVLTRQLLIFSRQQQPQYEIVDINEIASKLNAMLRRIVKEDIDLVTELGPSLPAIYTDAGQIEQVIMNLVVNARDALPNGGRITVATRIAAGGNCPSPACAGGVTPTGILLSVADTGHGMSAEVQSHIFEPFFTTKAIGKGTGLGLSTVYGIVKQAGGHISCQSEVGRGTTFTIHLPANRAEPLPVPVESGPNLSHCGTERILLVEDDALVRDSTSRMLRRCGYTVLEATDGLHALELLASMSEHIDLVITDLVMPQMSGDALAAQIRQRRPEMPLIFLSGHAEGTTSHRTHLDPGDSFLQKPYQMDQLTAKVRAALR